MTGVEAARFPWRNYLLFLLGIVIFACWPLLSAIASSMIAQANGCVLNEAGANPCVVMGMDIGGALATAFVVGWLMFATLPFGVVALLIWGVTLIIHRLSFEQRRKGNS